MFFTSYHTFNLISTKFRFFPVFTQKNSTAHRLKTVSGAINLSNLDSFQISDISEYATQTKRYGFDDFDDQFYRLPPLQNYLVQYIRANPESF